MTDPAIFSPALFQPAQWLSGAHIGLVTDVNDPDSQGRIQIQILASDPDGEALIWARVATAFAGDNYGFHAIPDVGEEVLILFAGNDSMHPIVIGSLWNGSTQLPDEIGSNGVDRWSLNGKAGTRIAIVEESSGSEKVEIETPGGAKITVTDEGGGRVTCKASGNTVKLSGSGITVKSPSKVSVEAATVEVSAGMVTVDSAFSQFSGVVQCDMLISNTVISSTYTPGAGNIW
ncbi:hypothetical protein MNBD_ALPHA04-1382 [hydrothermal vent metagenome]|uniref:Gp5/Type VI secretion system Vgr protein OB-fold domain-containing protein n=1 Tax=hydrothermal vent metagenome TaxID=652676 RepID=A0A3B0SRJ0_9ZZZZ